PYSCLLLEQLAEQPTQRISLRLRPLRPLRPRARARAGSGARARDGARRRRRLAGSAAHVVQPHFAHGIEVSRIELRRLLEVLERLRGLFGALVEHPAVEVRALAVWVLLDAALEDEALLQRLFLAHPLGLLGVEPRERRHVVGLLAVEGDAALHDLVGLR